MNTTKERRIELQVSSVTENKELQLFKNLNNITSFFSKRNSNKHYINLSKQNLTEQETGNIISNL